MNKGLLKFIFFLILLFIIGGMYYKYRITHSLEKQIEMFKINNEAVQQRAVAYMVRQGKHSIPYLIEALSSEDTSVRINAVRALGRIDDPRVVDPLVSLLTDPYPDIQYEVMEALENRGKKIITRLLKSLESPSSKTRARTVELIGRIGDLTSKDIVEHALTDPSAEVREQAVIALRWIAKEESIDLILPLLDDPYTNVRMMVVFAFGEFKENADARRGLEQALTNDDNQLREKAVQFLGESNNPDVEEAIIPVLQDKDLKVRWAAAEALGKIGGERSLQALRKHIVNKREVEFVVSSAKKAIIRITERLHK
ncbi:MAG: HEAT repeat domain-containing protein [bacterium]